MKNSDKRRLDWLDKQDGGIDSMGYGEYHEYFGKPFPTAREQIDKMMALEKPKRKQRDAAGERKEIK